MTLVGVITTVGLILALLYALKMRADNVVFRAWGWLFICMCASTAAVMNNAQPEHYLWWYGIPATLAVPALLFRFIQCKCMTMLAATFISLFGFNTLALAVGLDGVHLYAGVTLLAVTVWLQIIFIFLLARAHPCPDDVRPRVRDQVAYGKKKDAETSELFVKPQLDLWWWHWLETSWRAKYAKILHLDRKHEEPHNGTTG